jgi:hypothetical protein
MVLHHNGSAALITSRPPHPPAYTEKTYIRSFSRRYTTTFCTSTIFIPCRRHHKIGARLTTLLQIPMFFWEVSTVVDLMLMIFQASMSKIHSLLSCPIPRAVWTTYELSESWRPFLGVKIDLILGLFTQAALSYLLEHRVIALLASKVDQVHNVIATVAIS